MKGLLLCAGRGTRLYPLSFSQPKTLLPVANQPVLHYCIRKLVEIGVTDIGIVIHPSQTQIPEFVGDGKRYGASVTFIEQPEQLGIAHAVQLAQPFLQEEPFLLMLGDNLLMDSLGLLHQTFLSSRADCAVLLREVDRPQDYGIAEVRDGRIVSIEEKPKQPKSNLAIIGAYLLTHVIFESIAALTPSARGEYEITDAIQGLIDRGYKVAHTLTSGKYFDVGTMDRWLAANRWVLREELGSEVQIGTDTVVENCEFIGPVLIGNRCRLRNCRLGPYVSVQDGAELINCEWIENSILLENTSLIDIEWVIESSVFGRSSHLIGNASAHSGVFIVSDKSYILLPLHKKVDDS